MRVLFLLLTVITLFADPRTNNHGVCIVPFESGDSTLYYLTWSSAFEIGWEHDIYNGVVSFNSQGQMTVVEDMKRYIGNGEDEAQEPVHCALDIERGVLLSVWEDGSDNDAPNVRGQLHYPNGDIIRENWIIAGGVGSQHSANTSQLANSFVVLYADEAAPATVGAVVKAKVIDAETGEEAQSLHFSPNDEDHWWPLSVSNREKSRTLVVWGNDGYAVMGTVLFDSAGVIRMVSSPQDYLVNTQQYYYQVAWLENLNRFIVVARDGAYENLTEKSKVCLIDSMGVMTDSFVVDGGILREAKMATEWHHCDSSYSILFPTGNNGVFHIRLRETLGKITQSSATIGAVQKEWGSTGIWGEFVKDVNGNEIAGKKLAFFIMNDTGSNNISAISLAIDTTNFCEEVSLLPLIKGSKEQLISYTIEEKRVSLPQGYEDWHYSLCDLRGRMIGSGTIRNGVISLPVGAAQMTILSIGKQVGSIKHRLLLR